MFFDFSFNKISRILFVTIPIVAGAFGFASLFPQFTIGYISDMVDGHVNHGQSTLSYWWNYKLLESGETRPLGENLLAAPGILFSMVGNLFAKHVTHAQSGNAKSVPVLLYHGESEESSTMPLPQFIAHMRALKADGWQTITVEELYAYLYENKSLPDKSFLLTFDDGRKDSYYPVDPVLKDLGFTAVMYVITGLSLPAEESQKSTFYLSRAELQTMQDSGRWELQSHGKEDHVYYDIDGKGTEGHFLSNKLWVKSENRLETDAEFRERVTYDLTNSRDTLQTMFGRPVISFAYPFSDYGPGTINFPGSKEVNDELVPSAYKMAFYQAWASDGDTFNYPGIDTYRVKRFEPSKEWSGEDLITFLNGGRVKALPYESSSFGVDWFRTWGVVATSDASLRLSADSESAGAATFLNGTGSWSNYSFEALGTLEGGESIMLTARQKNTDNYVFCAFTKNGVSLREKTNATTTTLASQKVKIDMEKPFRLGITVSGNHASCESDGDTLTRSEAVSPTLKTGSAGIQIWDEKNGVAKATITRVSATSY